MFQMGSNQQLYQWSWKVYLQAPKTCKQEEVMLKQKAVKKAFEAN